MDLGFPEFRHWPIHQVGKISDEEYGHGDGGHLENLGIMPLLARQVKNIIVFVNSKTKFCPEAQQNPYSESLEPLFRAVVDKESKDSKFDTNVVFQDDGKFDALISGLNQQKDEGKTLIHCDTYTVKNNSHYQIAEPYEVNVCWIYNEAVSAWNEALNAETKNIVSRLSRFPHYRTFFQNRPKIIDLNIKEVNALAHLSCWNVTSNETAIRSHFKL